MEKYTLNPIGKVRSERGDFQILIDKSYREGLKELNRFSHVIVSWWADKVDNENQRSELVTDLPYAKESAGVFACRSEYRPNPIGITTCGIASIEEQEGIVSLWYIDALNGTPVLDLKPYIPVSDRIRDVRVAEWFADWPDWYEDGAAFFSKNPF